MVDDRAERYLASSCVAASSTASEIYAEASRRVRVVGEDPSA